MFTCETIYLKDRKLFWKEKSLTEGLKSAGNQDLNMISQDNICD